LTNKQLTVHTKADQKSMTGMLAGNAFTESNAIIQIPRLLAAQGNSANHDNDENVFQTLRGGYQGDDDRAGMDMGLKASDMGMRGGSQTLGGGLHVDKDPGLPLVIAVDGPAASGKVHPHMHAFIYKYRHACMYLYRYMHVFMCGWTCSGKVNICTHI
jgi:hypothetical protein